MPEQYPIEQYAVGGQSAIDDLIVLEEVDGFEETPETHNTTAGQFKCDLVFSRRKTKSVSVELANTATVTDYVKGGYVSALFVPSTPSLGVWEIRGVTQTRTRGATQLSLELVSMAEEVA